MLKSDNKKAFDASTEDETAKYTSENPIDYSCGDTFTIVPDNERCANAAGDPRETNFFCKTDADCTEEANGVCMYMEYLPSGGDCYCAYLCKNDDDCVDGERCYCTQQYNYSNGCHPAECYSEEDCNGNDCVFGHSKFFCRNPEGDECQTWEDCMDIGFKGCDKETAAETYCHLSLDCVLNEENGSNKCVYFEGDI